jgi:hypothetical protein
MPPNYRPHCRTAVWLSAAGNYLIALRTTLSGALRLVNMQCSIGAAMRRGSLVLSREYRALIWGAWRVDREVVCALSLVSWAGGTSAISLEPLFDGFDV